MTKLEDLALQVARLEDRCNDYGERQSRLEQQVKSLESRCRKFVHHNEYQPVKMAVYGGIAIALTTLIGSIIALVVRS